MRRRAQRAADIRPELQRHEAGGKRRRGAARRPAGAAAEIPGVVGGAEDVVVALPVGQVQRHVGFAEDHGAGILQALHGKGVSGGVPAPELPIAPAGRQADDIELLLDRHRQAEQRPALALRQGGVGGRGGFARPLEIAHDDGVDLRVDPLDAGNRGIDELARRDLLAGERL